ncbi:N-succinylarginine dihydrolase [Iodidimonas nitroreducens]|uniref:N-succinylarginine dihydrolase n=1 Tax=Iodidimonas nitroreducens TaxID=1236968 RepID=A0A5A7N8H3_9PROT|nr:N-succinylarginine dihydrolase [Iodidimonas nitroreducens]GAK33605.1 N-succinylarginine dihydrolase [alpha proteobacterium Q-1]GER03700.1 N-succinylarginine dihydrolase [Iodidimonas nitroreducens]
MVAREFNFDGLVGPTHNYAGLSYGNEAAQSHALQISNPREGALQGLEKMRSLMKMGLGQAILPPHERPHIKTLRRLGFSGSDQQILERAIATAPELVRNLSSASAMWTANAATITPSSDSHDGRLHITPANLVAMFHRSIEHPVTARVLQSIFPEGARFGHHPALPSSPHMGDEGAANHNRFSSAYDQPGLHLFVYGAQAFSRDGAPKRYPARQTREASEAIARQHGVKSALFVQQNPVAIDAGAFHNDVVAVSNGPVFFYHEQAFADPAALEENLAKAAPAIDFSFIRVPAAEVSLKDAVKSYLFNSQLLSLPHEPGMTLILPMEVAETPSAKAYVDRLLAQNKVIGAAQYLDVRQSMRNGGGPACLRLRVVLTEAERDALGAGVILDEARIDALSAWVNRHYRDRLSADDLRDPHLLDESRTALDELTGLLGLGPVYDFQREAD